MQRNPGCKTIEGDLHTALVKAGGIAAENSDDFAKVGRILSRSEVDSRLILPHNCIGFRMQFHGQVSWSRAARTDKGVSAVGQVSCPEKQHEKECCVVSCRLVVLRPKSGSTGGEPQAVFATRHGTAIEQGAASRDPLAWLSTSHQWV
jgi:hypothetical protein